MNKRAKTKAHTRAKLTLASRSQRGSDRTGAGVHGFLTWAPRQIRFVLFYIYAYLSKKLKGKVPPTPKG